MSNSIENEILAQEQRLVEAKRSLDLAALDQIYADDLLMTGVLGEPTCSKSAIVEEVRRGIAQRDDAMANGRSFRMWCENEDLRMTTHGEAAVTSFRFVVTVTGENVDVRRSYRTTNVWVKRGGRWQVVAAHTAFVIHPAKVAELAGEAPA